MTYKESVAHGSQEKWNPLYRGQSTGMRKKATRRFRKYIKELQRYVKNYSVGHWVERYEYIIHRGKRISRNG